MDDGFIRCMTIGRVFRCPRPKLWACTGLHPWSRTRFSGRRSSAFCDTNGKGFYMSLDKGATFDQMKAADHFPEVNLAGIESRQDYKIRVEIAREGVIWMAMKQPGLWR